MHENFSKKDQCIYLRNFWGRKVAFLRSYSRRWLAYRLTEPWEKHLGSEVQEYS